MKKGKTSQLNLFNDAKCYYGTVDAVNLKTVYIVLQTWVEPIKEFENWSRSTGVLERYIKHTLLEVVDNIYFEKHCIVDLDLRSSGIKKGKRSFMNLEITMYVKNDLEFKSPILREKIKTIITSVYQDNIKGSGFFKIHLSKNSKQKILEEV
jgi:hypothetical protein